MEDFANRLKLSSGSTLINLACSGHADWAMVSGAYYWLVGDSSSGKTVLTLGVLAEASINPAFDGFDLIFDNAEDGALMPIEKFYGKRLLDRIQPPSKDGDEWVNSHTIDEFYYHLDDRLKAAKKKNGRPFIYLLDSMDSLDTEYAEEKFQASKKAHESGKEAAGDYGDGKAKINSTHIRRVRAELQETNSILIILSQTRDNPAATRFQKKKVSAGGHALKFYAHWQLWSSIKGDLKKSVNGQDRQIGIIAKISVEKNRISGKEWVVEIPIYWSYGIDNIGSCIDYLVTEKKFKAKDGGIIIAPALDFEGKRALLVEKIESENLEAVLHGIVEETWKDIESRCSVQLKSRYD